MEAHEAVTEKLLNMRPRVSDLYSKMPDFKMSKTPITPEFVNPAKIPIDYAQPPELVSPLRRVFDLAAREHNGARYAWESHHRVGSCFKYIAAICDVLQPSAWLTQNPVLRNVSVRSRATTIPMVILCLLGATLVASARAW
jgi:hypothetical protein